MYKNERKDFNGGKKAGKRRAGKAETAGIFSSTMDKIFLFFLVTAIENYSIRQDKD